MTEPKKITAEERAQNYMNQFKQENKMDDFLESVSGLGEDVQKDAGESLEALKKPVQEMMSNKNSSLPTQLHQLKEVVADLEPNYLKDGNVKKFINRLFRRNPIQQYAQKYKTVESQVDQIVEGLLSGKDRLQEDSLMLKELKVVARQRITALEEQMEIGHALNDMLEKEMTEEQWRDNPAQIQKGQQKVISRIKNMSQAVMVLQQSIASVDLIIENNEKLEEAIFNAITMTKNIITVTASIQLALGNQQKVIRAVKNVNEATESMLLSNAQMLKQNSEDTLKTLEEPAIAVDAFKKAYEDVFSAIQLTEQSNERIITSGKKFIEEMDTLNKEMKTKLLS
nr:toxic anion resistance protein [Bacillus sp. FJAT-45350]